MKWKKNLLSVLLKLNVVLFGLGSVFGLTNFYYSTNKKIFVEHKNLNRFCKLMGLAFFVLYPTSFIILLDDFHYKSTSVTDLARNSIYIDNWIICSLIFVNQISYPTESCDIYNRARALYLDIYNNDNIDFKLNFSAKCVFKSCFLVIGFFLVNITKFYYLVAKFSSVFHFVLLIYLFFPSFIMFLTSNRFYVAASFFSYLIMKNNDDIETAGEGYRGIMEIRKMSVDAGQLSMITAEKIKTLAKNHAQLHQLFVDFNAMFAKYIVLILGLCVINVVFEVNLF